MVGMAAEPAGMTGWFGRWRRARAMQRQAIDARQWQRVVSRLSFLRMLPAEDQRRLCELVAVFLDRKTINGAGGLNMTREMQLIIAAQACLLVLNLDLDFYDDWVEVIVYPAEFVVDHEYTDEDGVVHRVRAPLSGEAWEQGPVILSWEDAEAADGGDGYNVVMHEFAHKIDLMNGDADGVPPFSAALHPGLDARRWRDTLADAYARFVAELEIIEGELPRDIDPESSAADPYYAHLPLDAYAAQDEGEFFAVSSEAFFVDPARLERAFPHWYALLAAFFRQDPRVAA